MEDTHGLYVRVRGSMGYLFVDVTDMVGACGRDADPEQPFVWDVSFVNLAAADDRELKRACDCVGLRPEELEEMDVPMRLLALAQAAHDYGLKAPLDGGGAKRFEHARAAGIRAAQKYSDEALEERLDRVVNEIGSTARDFMRGDSLAGLKRAAEDVVCRGAEATPEQALMMKMYAACGGQTLGGVTEESRELSVNCAIAVSAMGGGGQVMGQRTLREAMMSLLEITRLEKFCVDAAALFKANGWTWGDGVAPGPLDIEVVLRQLVQTAYASIDEESGGSSACCSTGCLQARFNKWSSGWCGTLEVVPLSIFI